MILKRPKAVAAFLEYIYQAFYRQVAEVRGFITPDMWAVQKMLGAKDLTEQVMLKEAQIKLRGAWKRDSENPNSFENFLQKCPDLDVDQEVPSGVCSVQSTDTGTDEADRGHSEPELLQDSGQGSN